MRKIIPTIHSEIAIGDCIRVYEGSVIRLGIVTATLVDHVLFEDEFGSEYYLSTNQYDEHTVQLVQRNSQYLFEQTDSRVYLPITNGQIEQYICTPYKTVMEVKVLGNVRVNNPFHQARFN